ncbi:MAG: RNA polymerase sigma factor [Terriglobia bacterium]
MSSQATNTDYDLLARMRAGDESAFAEIYRRHQGKIYRFALHMTGSPAAAEDVTQEVFMALICQPERFDSLKGSLQAYLYGIGRNHALRHLERERGLIGSGETAIEESPAHSRLSESEAYDVLRDLTRQEMVKRVQEAVQSLPAIYREVVVLCDLQEMSYAEAAQVLASAAGTIRSRLHRARGLLLRKLQALHQAAASQSR